MSLHPDAAVRTLLAEDPDCDLDTALMLSDDGSISVAMAARQTVERHGPLVIPRRGAGLA